MAGSVDPVNAIVFSGVLKIFALNDTDEQQSKAVMYGMFFLALGCASLIGYIFEVSALHRSHKF